MLEEKARAHALVVVLLLILVGSSLALLTTAIQTQSAMASPAPLPDFRLSLNISSASGFAVGERANEPQLTLLRGERGTIQVTVTSLTDKVLNVALSSTLGAIGASVAQKLPPGVTAEFAPAMLTLAHRENKSATLTLSADKDAPVGAYYYHVAASSSEFGVGGPSFWLVIGPYTPHQNFSLVDFNDYIAKNDTTISIDVVEGTSTALGPEGFIVRSEGQPIQVRLDIANIDVPESVNLTLAVPANPVFVQAGSQTGVDVFVKIPYGVKLGTYHFQVVATSGSEKHTANFELSIVAHMRPGSPWVLVDQNISGYHFDLSDRYGGSVTEGVETGFAYAITPLNSSLPSETYATITVALNKTRTLFLPMLLSDAPREFTVMFDRVGHYNITMTGFAKEADGTLKRIGSASTPFEVEAKQPSPAPTQAYAAALIIGTLAAASTILYKSTQGSQLEGLAAKFSQRTALLMALGGIAILLAVPFLSAYSYSVTSRSMEGSLTRISITYVYPFSGFIPIFLVAGSLWAALGFWILRSSLAKHRREIVRVILFGALLTALSLTFVQHVISVDYEAYERGLPFPWLFYVVNTVMPVNAWEPSLVGFYDLLFWTALGHLGLLIAKRLGRLGWRIL